MLANSEKLVFIVGKLWSVLLITGWVVLALLLLNHVPDVFGVVLFHEDHSFLPLAAPPPPNGETGFAKPFAMVTLVLLLFELLRGSL